MKGEKIDAFKGSRNGYNFLNITNLPFTASNILIIVTSKDKNIISINKISLTK